MTQNKDAGLCHFLLKATVVIPVDDSVTAWAPGTCVGLGLRFVGLMC